MKFTTKIIPIFLLSLFLSCSSDNDASQEVENKLENIQGRWIRVGGNNPSNNGMIVNVINNKGFIVEPSQTEFMVDDVKWNDIVAQEENHYRYDELGSNYEYYPSSIRFGVDDTLRISVDQQPGAGYIQKWVRN